MVLGTLVAFLPPTPSGTALGEMPGSCAGPPIAFEWLVGLKPRLLTLQASPVPLTRWHPEAGLFLATEASPRQTWSPLLASSGTGTPRASCRGWVGLADRRPVAGRLWEGRAG